MTRLRIALHAAVLLAGTLAVSGCWHRPGYAYRRGYYDGRYYDGRGRGHYQSGYYRGYNRGYYAPRAAPRSGYVPPPAPAYRY